MTPAGSKTGPAVLWPLSPVVGCGAQEGLARPNLRFSRAQSLCFLNHRQEDHLHVFYSFASL